jgi:hypothetical protein
MKTGWIAVAMLLLGSHGAAQADDEGGASKLSIGGSLAVWFPTSDADDFADTSLGVRGQATYWIREFVGVTGGFDFVFVNEDGPADVTYYVISAGGRLQLPRGRIRPYGELVLGWHFLDTDGFDDSNIGFRIGGGATYALSPALVLGGGLGYSTTSIDTGFFDITVAAFIFDVSLAVRL